MHWKKRLMTPPPEEDRVVEIIRGGGATSQKLNRHMKYTDQSSDAATVRGWDELNINEKCDRLGKWIGHIMNKLEEKEQ